MKTIAIDYYGVIRRDSELVDGAKESIERLSKDYNLIVFTTENVVVAQQWLRAHGITLNVTNTKPVAQVYIDDRALRFVSWYDVCKYFL